MNRAPNDLFDARIAEWLEDGPDKAPSIVLKTLNGALSSIPQRHSWRGFWRPSAMARLAVAGAALAIVLVVGLSFVLLRGIKPEHDPGKSPLLSPSPTPSSSATTSFSPSGVAPARPVGHMLFESGGTRALSAGTYYVTGGDFAVRFGIVLPDGWSYVVPEDGYSHQSDFTLQNSGEGALKALQLYVLDKTYADPCHTESGPASLLGGSDALVGALARMAGFQLNDVQDASIGGVPAKALTLTNSIDTATAGCSGGDQLAIGTFSLTGDPDAEANLATTGGATDHLWIVDVDGTTLLIVPRLRGDSPGDFEAAQALLDGLWFMPYQVSVPATPGANTLNQAYASEVTGVVFDYPAGWVVLPAEPDLQTVEGRHEDYMFVRATNFTLAYEELRSGQTASQWLDSHSPTPASECEAREAVSIGGVSGYLTHDNCYNPPSLSGWDTWSDAVAIVGNRGYVFTMRKLGPDSTAWLNAFLATVEFQPE